MTLKSFEAKVVAGLGIFKHGADKVREWLDKIDGEVETDAAEAEAVTATVLPGAVPAEQAAVKIAASVTALVDAADNAVDGEGLNVTLDSATVAAAKSLASATKTAVAAL
jgi:hypothetical protein